MVKDISEGETAIQLQRRVGSNCLPGVCLGKFANWGGSEKKGICESKERI